MDYQPVKRKGAEKLLCALLVLVIIVAVILGVLLALTLMKDKKGSDLCQTSDCVKASSLILSNANLKADPCDDFYEFACGEFIRSTSIPASRTNVDAFAKQSMVIDEQIHEVLEEPMKSEDTRTMQVVKKVYRTCMNETDIEINAMPTVKNILRKLGGWPVVEGNRWDESRFDWISTLLNLRDYGMIYTMFMDFNVELDNKNSSRRVLTIDQPYIAFEATKRGPRNNHILDATHKFMVSIAVEYGAEKRLAEREMEEIIKFEMELVKIMVPQEERRDMEEEYNPINVQDLGRRYPLLPWFDFLNRLIAPSTISKNDFVVVYLPEYLEKLQPLLRGTPRRVLANYIFYKTVGSMLSYSNKKLREIQLEFTKATVGVASSLPRNEICTSVASRLDVAVGALYIKKYFDKEAKTNTEEIVRNIEAEYMETLKKVDWMDQETKTAALEKLQVMGKYIGYPEELMDDSKLEEYYENLHLNTDNYIHVILNVSKFQRERDMKLLDEPVVKSDWRSRSSVAIVNAFYDLNANAIQVPAGILQGVFFDAKRPQYLNYGGIGYIIGHEFTHGFDDEGSQMDKYGNLREWWKESTKEAYNNKAKCIVQQYSSMVVPEVNMTINGINTQGENIADNGGIKLAYRAYQNWVAKNKQEPNLPGLDFTPNQMFWIGAANVWCSKMKPEALQQDMLSEVHPPDRFRINVPFSNSEYFAKDFNCPKGSKMNPQKTCTVW